MKTRLLRADADQVLTELFARYFTRFGFDMRTSFSALDCVSQLRDYQPDVLVLDEDLLWGGANGVLAWLKVDGPLLRPRVVLAAGGTAAKYLSLQTALPSAHCLQRPFRLTTVLKHICASLDESRELEEVRRLTRHESHDATG